MEAHVWLGVPHSDASGVEDCRASRLGGAPLLFRACDGAARGCFACPRCRQGDGVSLVAQVHAPVGAQERVLYVMLCARCSEDSAADMPGTCQRLPSPLQRPAGRAEGALSPLLRTLNTSFCFALRSQTYNADYEEGAGQVMAEAAQGMFAEDDNWGDDRDDNAEEEGISTIGQEEQAHGVQDGPRAECGSDHTVYALAPCGQEAAGVAGLRYAAPGIVLDWRAEPPKHRATVSAEEEARRFEAACEQAKVDTTSVESAVTESAAEKCVRKYVERISRCGAQCVRWCLAGAPLRASLASFTVPPCPHCNAPRQYELQLTSPSVYFLTRGMGEAANAHLHYSNVLVYTCSRHCNAATSPYMSEYVFVEGEI